LLDQTRLPDETHFLEIDTVEAMVEAIGMLRVRGAPLIGIAAAMGLASAAQRSDREGAFTDDPALRRWLDDAARRLAAARPTAVNLGWAVARAQAEARDALDERGCSAAVLTSALRSSAQQIWDEDAAMCRAIAEAGAHRIPENASVLTVCNTGMLATGGIGTAFGVIRVAHQRGRVREVFACETRPLRQGSRLTAWELTRVGIPGTVIVDGAAAMVMSQGRIDVVVAGADRIAANGDSANKIGTQSLATLARAHGIPFYIAAPRSTIDLATATGDDIPIEERSADEIGIPAGARAYNPAFDVTPAALIAGIITDCGVLEPPFRESIAQVMHGVPA
jgi:methylthioribose-1-phosphate isomerase